MAKRLGSVGFDPFMNRCPDERYVRIATAGSGAARRRDGFVG
ncbi:hypothetical protein [Burkholderia ubonensis]|nr:hypothetical protein [Burkholderia ubonensis]